MSKTNRGGLVFSVLVVASLSPPAYADAPVVPACAVFQSCGQWATFSEGGYNLYNNIWGDGAGAQCIWACGHGNFGVWADHPATGGVKAYPNSEYPTIATRITAMASLTSTFDCTVPDSGAYTTTYDIWSGRRTEIMLWMNKQGAHEPWARQYDAGGLPIPEAANVTVGGHTWNVFWNGGPRGFNVFSMVRTSNTNAGTVDIKACLTWLKDNLGLGDVTIDKVQLGFEVSQSPGGSNFTMNAYDVSFSASGTSLPVAPTNLTASVATATSVALAWTDNSNNESGFQIERSTDGTNFSQIATVAANVASYPDGGLTTGTAYSYRVRAFNGAGNSAYTNVATATPLQLGSGTGLIASYFDNGDLTSLKVTRTDATVNFNWGNGSPDPSVAPDSFSARWTGFIEPLFTETYTIETFSDDGDRVWVNGQQLINNWKAQHGSGTNLGTISLTAGVRYAITVEFMEISGGAAMQLYWSSPHQQRQIVPQTQLYAQ
jgi:hypothetical protein